MAFLLRHGFGVYVGLLVVLSTFLGGSEGLKCYLSLLGRVENVTVCEPHQHVCSWGLTSGGTEVMFKGCGSFIWLNKECMEKKFKGGRCYNMSEYARIVHQECKKPDPVNNTRDSQESRQNGYEDDQHCYCDWDLCNNRSLSGGPAGYENPSKLVIFAVVVSASLYIFNTDVASGSF